MPLRKPRENAKLEEPPEMDEEDDAILAAIWDKRRTGGATVTESPKPKTIIVPQSNDKSSNG